MSQRYIYGTVTLCFLLLQVVDRLSAQLAGRLNFEYQDPQKNFDRSKVKGLVAKLIDVKDKTHSTALEVAAGGRLYQARNRARGGQKERGGDWEGGVLTPGITVLL